MAQSKAKDDPYYNELDGGGLYYEGCENDDTVDDSYGDTCTDWYDPNP